MNEVSSRLFVETRNIALWDLKLKVVRLHRYVNLNVLQWSPPLVQRRDQKVGHFLYFWAGSFPEPFAPTLDRPPSSPRPTPLRRWNPGWTRSWRATARTTSSPSRRATTWWGPRSWRARSSTGPCSTCTTCKQRGNGEWRKGSRTPRVRFPKEAVFFRIDSFGNWTQEDTVSLNRFTTGKFGVYCESIVGRSDVD